MRGNSAFAIDSAATVRSRFSGNFEECQIAAWKDIQAQKVLPKFMFGTFQIALKIFFLLKKLKTNNHPL